MAYVRPSESESGTACLSSIILVIVNPVDPQHVADDPTKAVSSLSDSAGHMITQANSAGCAFNALTEVQTAACAAKNATAIDKANAITQPNRVGGVTVTVRAEASQSCSPAKMIDNVETTNAQYATEDGKHTNLTRLAR